MSELKDKEVEKVAGGTFLPTVGSLAPDEFEIPVSVIKDEIPNIELEKKLQI